MSSLYKPSEVAGVEYTRAHQIVIDNRAPDQPPTITFFEERVLNAANGERRRFPQGQLRVGYDPAAEIPLLNPQTGEDTGATLSLPEIYAAVYSIYMHAAKARDAEQGEIT